MSRWLMIFVGIVYLLAAVAAINERKWWWVVVLVCWAIAQYALTKTMVQSCVR